MLKEAIEEEKSSKEIVAELKDAVAKHNITESVSGSSAFPGLVLSSSLALA